MLTHIGEKDKCDKISLTFYKEFCFSSKNNCNNYRKILTIGIQINIISKTVTFSCSSLYYLIMLRLSSTLSFVFDDHPSSSIFFNSMLCVIDYLCL